MLSKYKCIHDEYFEEWGENMFINKIHTGKKWIDTYKKWCVKNGNNDLLEELKELTDPQKLQELQHVLGIELIKI